MLLVEVAHPISFQVLHLERHSVTALHNLVPNLLDMLESERETTVN